ncbi:hypothetical protein H634G_09377 [Metarhizium anisopliae BRIP 53293]|uniref:Uncharacterized protein n=1 Tax=Metarhizium anisopliae BRIP 53293 TaxID=1291518 RepID=A0A0D9NN36_METAN|nr:hypothetical protein H634G_09377 [Metarhizium anisopliae BRIP 53293]KJK91774.1 hypothetical protein H633G_04390 [Metarhizium anisopliae BRIP 53284]
MKLLAATIALSALAAAVPQRPDMLYMVTGPCTDLRNTICGVNDMVEDPNVKGNRISCRFYQGEKQDDLLCQVNQLSKGQQAKDDASEICGALGGCTCAWSTTERKIRKRIGGRIVNFNCLPNPKSKNTPAAREQFLKSIDEAAATACRSDQDESTCQSYKLDCIHTLSQGEHEDPITPDEVERCVEDRIRKNRAPSTAR